MCHGKNNPRQSATFAWLVRSGYGDGMKPRHQNRRLALVALFSVILIVGVTLLLSALRENTQFFYNPSEILAEDFVSKSEDIRIGGLVLAGSVEKRAGLVTTFNMADFPEDPSEIVDVNQFIKVSYTGVLPDLFREGQGVVVTGNLVAKDELVASNVLAKHDENYQPKK